MLKIQLDRLICILFCACSFIIAQMIFSQCEYHEEFNNLDDDTYVPKKVRNLTQKYFQNLTAL